MIVDTPFDKMFASLETLPEDLIVIIPDDANVNITMSGEFIRSLRITMEYMFSSLSEAELIVFMQKAGKAFEGVPQDEITDRQEYLRISLLLMRS